MSWSATSTQFLNTSRDSDSTTSLGSLFQCLITRSVKAFFLIYNLNLPWWNLRPLPLILTLVTWEKRPTPTSLQPPFRWKVLWDSFLNSSAYTASACILRLVRISFKFWDMILLQKNFQTISSCTWAPCQCNDKLEKTVVYYCHLVPWQNVWLHLKCDLEKKWVY